MRTVSRLHYLIAILVLLCTACSRLPSSPASAASAKLSPSPPASANAQLLGDLQRPDPKSSPSVTSHIDAVTVYSDRALVRRRATVKLRPGVQLLRFSALPGWIDEGSVRASVSRGKIIDLAVSRQFLAQPSDPAFRKAEEQHRALLRRQQALDDELQIMAQQNKHVESMKLFSVDKLRKDVLQRDIKIRSYGKIIDFVSDTLRRTARARRDIEAQRQRLLPEIKASRRQLDELKRLTKLEQSTVEVQIASPSASPAQLSLSYSTPGATWEPQHDLRTSRSTPDTVELSSFAVVTQTTGEDWTKATLRFSTQSASDRERIPELKMLALGKTERRTRRRVHRTSSFSRAQRKYTEQSRHWNRLKQANLGKLSELQHFEKTYTNNIEYYERIQTRSVALFEGLKQRGTTVHFRATESAIVRSDGRSIRLKIGGKRLAARPKILAAPEESLNAAVTLAMVNRTGQPLLPGSVARFLDGAFLGMTDIDFVAKGESFSTFFRVADRIKLRRTLDRKKSSIVRHTNTRMSLSFLTSAQNLSREPVTLALAERVPVSENTAIRLSGLRISPRIKPDEKGIVRWSVTLQPGETKEFRTAYVLDYPPSLIFDVRRRQRQRPRRGPKLKLMDRLELYEKML